MKWFVLPLHQFPGRTLALSITTTKFSNSIRLNRIENFMTFMGKNSTITVFLLSLFPYLRIRMAMADFVNVRYC